MKNIFSGKRISWILILLLFTTTGAYSASVSLDFDGDGKTDIVVQWSKGGGIGSRDVYILQSRDGFRAFSSAVPLSFACADYDGDGKYDPAVYRAESPQSYFYLQQSRDGFKAIPWGLPNDGPGLGIGYLAPVGP